MSTVMHRAQFRLAALIAVSLAFAAVPAVTSGQSLSGRVVDAATREPIDGVLVLLLTESGDSVTHASTDRSGSFSVASPLPGSFRLMASALGYRATRAGVFDLGMGGEMTLEIRLTPEPVPIDTLLVSTDRPAREHFLVRNCFVRRSVRGMGYFVTPHDIAESFAITTEGLLVGIPGIRVRPGGAFLSHLGDVVEMRGPQGNTCQPSLLVDGRKVDRGLDPGLSLSSIVPLSTVSAVEVYRSPAEIPLEYDFTRSPDDDLCGVILIWTKQER